MNNEHLNLEQVIEQLAVVHIPHPTLRRVSKPLVKVDRFIKRIVERMFELMYEHRGIGLAANQVALPFQLFVINLESDPDQGEQQVFINPVIDRPKGNNAAEEGCLSIPSIYGNVTRPESVRIRAFDLTGNKIDETVDGMMARAVQHEFDHLQGVLFLDRMGEYGRKSMMDELEAFQTEFQSKQRSGEIPNDAEIESRCGQLENLYCGS